MNFNLNEEYATMHKRNMRKAREARRNPNVKWAVQYLNEELMRGAGTQTVRPYQTNDEHNYKKMLALYQETKRAHPEWSIWLVGITKDWKQKNIFYHAGI